MMTKELFERISKYEEKLHTAYYSDFVRLADPSMKRELAQLHKEMFGTEGNILNGCNRCVLSALKNMGREYFRFKKQLEAEEMEKAKKAEEVRKELEPDNEAVDNQEVKETKKKTATNKTKKTTKKK